MTVLVVLLAVVVGLLTLLVVSLLRSHAEILRALHELGLNDVLDPDADERDGVRSDADIRTRPGVATPRSSDVRAASDLLGNTPDGGSLRVAVSGVDHSTLVAFLSTGCLTCANFWEAFADPDRRELPGADTRLVIVTKGLENESPARLEELAPRGVTLVASSSAWDDYEVPVAPYFLLVDGPEGAILGEGAAASWDQVQDLLGQAMADAGLDTKGGSSRRSRARGAQRVERADEELERAGILPGDPSLYPGGEPPEARP